MADTSLLKAVKDSMRITHNALDDDFNMKINSALKEMERVGIDIPASVDVSKDFLIVTGCELYVKWLDNYEGRGEEYRRAFRQVRDSMALSSEYKADEADV